MPLQSALHIDAISSRTPARAEISATARRACSRPDTSAAKACSGPEEAAEACTGPEAAAAKGSAPLEEKACTGPSPVLEDPPAAVFIDLRACSRPELHEDVPEACPRPELHEDAPEACTRRARSAVIELVELVACPGPITTLLVEDSAPRAC